MQNKHTVIIEIESTVPASKSGCYRVAVGIIGPGISKVRVSQTWAERQSLIPAKGIEVAS